MPDEPETTAVPPALVTVQDFLNTLDERSFSVRGTRHLGGDELATGAALAGWLAGRGLIPAGTQPTDADLAAAHRLRDALRGALVARASSGWAGRAGANGALAGLTLRIELSADGTPHLSPVAGTGAPGRADPAGSHRSPRGGGRQLAAAEDLRRPGLPVGVLRHLPQRRGPVVLDAGLRQP